jgi:peptidyl-dipeptidase Dcp
LRAQKSHLLGFPTFAAYALADQMAKTPDAALKLMNDNRPGGDARGARRGGAHAKADRRRTRRFHARPWDWQFYAERVRKADYDIDESEVRPYFELNRVLTDGVFFAATRLYGVTFHERHDLPVYQPRRARLGR